MSNFSWNYNVFVTQKNFIFFKIKITRLKGILVGRGACRFDNVTIITENMYSVEEVESYCGNNIPPLVRSVSRIEIIFMTDRYVQRNGFQFKYFLNSKSLASFLHIDDNYKNYTIL